MTTYSYTIVLDDSEAIMLEAALNLMDTHCREQLSEGPKAPFWAHQQSARSVLKKLRQSAKQTSGNNFFESDE
jgi:hypothetical protein